MELFLNIAWLLLAIPAIWISRSHSSPAESRGYFGRFRPWVLLGCILFLLFPVVSATDDLHAMRTEAEEFSVSKRLVRVSAAAKSSLDIAYAGGVFVPPSAFLFNGNSEVFGPVFLARLFLPGQAPFRACESRGPPRLLLG